MASALLAWDLTQDCAIPDETKELTLFGVPFREAVGMAWKGEIRDALTVAALLKVEMLRVRGELPAVVAAYLSVHDGASAVNRVASMR